MAGRKSRKSQHRALLYQARKQYDEMLELQGGHCALCQSAGGTRKLHIDHDHATMEVRGLLCFRHNAMLKSWMTPDLLRAAADYLERPPWATRV